MQYQTILTIYGLSIFFVTCVLCRHVIGPVADCYE